ncbi:MAG TPA: ATP-binding cassette domain-containing protein, partial [Ignavibacteriaceae bacterium]|nr:ATP-binding cassette domain-containing protein [Ignavibacteriaceae bacterium]
MPILLKNISKFYDSLKALDKVSLEISDGKATVLIGPSGSGKSTFIRIITGLIPADEGEVIINGEKLSKDSVVSVRRNIGYVIQEGGLFPHLSAFNNVCLMAKHLKWNKEKIESRIKELCRLTKFPAEGLEKFPSELSGGQRQRVSLMRALMLDPQVLLLDEPLGSLDPLIRFELQNDLKEIFRNLKKTVVMVTHDLSEAAFFADKMVLMKEG